MTSSKVSSFLAVLVLAAACGRTPLEESPAARPGGKAGTGGASPGDSGGSGGGAGQTGSGGVSGTGGETGTGGGSGTGGSAPPPDAGPPRPDASPPIDAREEPPRVSCPSTTTARPRRAVHLEGMVRGPARWEASWRVIAAPPTSGIARGPFTGTGIDLVPDTVGDYSLRFEARDGRGNSDACVVTVQTRAIPPMVFCPREGRVTADRELMLTGDARDDDGAVKLLWSATPPGATFTPPDGATTRFRARQPGAYIVTLTATDIDGAQSACRTVVVVMDAPMAICPPSGEKYVRMREATFSARLEGSRMVSSTWTMIKRPAGSQAEPIPRSGLFTDVVPDLLGDYVLQFVARSPDGIESRCETSFVAVSEAPTLECPDIDTTPLNDTEISVGVSDNGDIVKWAWTLAAQPPGSAVRPMFPAGDTFTFRPDLAGDYGFTLTILDDEMLSASCKFSVHAAAEEGLRVEMFWDVPDTDMDLHLLSPLAKRWFDETTNQDCFYSNCTGTPPNWSNQSSDLDDPHLDIDDTDGFGPENINVDRPGPGVYRVGVHAFSGLTTSKVTVRVYCGGSRLEPRATVGPVALTEEQVWKIADVEIFADGRCEVRKLANADGSATVVSRANAQLAR